MQISKKFKTIGYNPKVQFAHFGICTSGLNKHFADRAEVISNTVNVDVISVGGYKSFEVCEENVNRGNIKGISMCRGLICEPDIIKRWQDGDYAKAECLNRKSLCYLVKYKH